MGLRVAFLTDEYVMGGGSSGGLASYLVRITQALKELGHTPEVFVVNDAEREVFFQQGVRVEVVVPNSTLFLRLAKKVQRRVMKYPWGGPVRYVSASLAMAQAFNRRHKEKPFHFVQSANCSSVGLFVRGTQHCPHIVRLSSNRSLWFAMDGYDSFGAKLMIWLENTAIRKADIAYAPSKFVAQSCQQKIRGDISVLRPPVFVEDQINEDVDRRIPEKYLIHFGQIGLRKGSDILARALCNVWEEVPEFKMVWAGRVIRDGDFERCHHLWGPNAVNVLWVGSVRKSMMYAILKSAVASVLPSRIDNLPNTVIESLMLGVPVIGTTDSSIDELVEPGVNGKLVRNGDILGLSDAMICAWRKGKGFVSPFRRPLIFDELNSANAAERLVKLAGY